jgi:hypothetical protein
MFARLQRGTRDRAEHAIPRPRSLKACFEMERDVASEWSGEKNLPNAIGKASERRLQCSKQSSTQP